MYINFYNKLVRLTNNNSIKIYIPTIVPLEQDKEERKPTLEPEVILAKPVN